MKMRDRSLLRAVKFNKFGRYKEIKINNKSHNKSQLFHFVSIQFI